MSCAEKSENPWPTRHKANGLSEPNIQHGNCMLTECVSHHDVWPPGHPAYLRTRITNTTVMKLPSSTQQRQQAIFIVFVRVHFMIKHSKPRTFSLFFSNCPNLQLAHGVVNKTSFTCSEHRRIGNRKWGLQFYSEKITLFSHIFMHVLRYSS